MVNNNNIIQVIPIMGITMVVEAGTGEGDMVGIWDIGDRSGG
jgi:hypothetical protein